MLPPSPPVLLAEKERALGNPVLRSVASTLCVLLLLGCAHSGVATVSALFDLANGNYDRLDRERKPLACSRGAIRIKKYQYSRKLNDRRIRFDTQSIVEVNQQISISVFRCNILK